MKETIAENDRIIIETQIKRKPRQLRRVASCCDFGCPQVVETEPFLNDGTPFPTLYWLTCPVKIKAVARLEDSGWAVRLIGMLSRDTELQAQLIQAQQEYGEARKCGVRDTAHPVYDKGIGGVRDLEAIKCLHAHYAHYLVSGSNPVGEMVAENLGAGACDARCDGK
ncbi:MAG: DUF501 domain-containing protein [Candidatus Aquicultor sp.]|nr:DUF501 domain-containing protein [Candidatus Aquicultor sp.]